MTLFSIQEENEKEYFTTELGKTKKMVSPRSTITKRLKKYNNAIELIPDHSVLPKNNEVLRIKTHGEIDCGHMFERINQISEVKHIVLSTWIISRENIQMLLDWVDSKPERQITAVISNRMKGIRKPEYAFLCSQFTERPNQIKFRIANSHAKSFSVETVSGEYYTVDGSANWTENPRIELYSIDNQKDSFLFNLEWMTEVINGR